MSAPAPQLMVVWGLNRVISTARCVNMDGEQINAFYLGQPPCPLSYVWVEQAANGYWFVIGTRGPQRLIHTDDFLWTDAAPAGGRFAEDEGWFMSTFTAGGTRGQSTSSYGMVGGERVATAAVLAATMNTNKNTTATLSMPAQPAMLWISARFVLLQTTTVAWSIGWNRIYCRFDTATDTTFNLVTAAGAATAIPTATIPVAGISYDIDIVASAGSFAALWISTFPTTEGVAADGPYVDTANVPTTATPNQVPFHNLTTNAAAVRQVDLDWLDTREVWELVEPAWLTTQLAMTNP